MKKYLLSLLALTFVSVLCTTLVSCGEDDEDSVSVSMTSVSFDGNGGSQSVQIKSNTKWTVSGAPSWLVVNPANGSKDGYITLTAQANKNKESRTCQLYIAAGNASTSIMVTQNGGKNSKQVTITNISKYTLYRFRVVFLNKSYEELTDHDYGTFGPDDTIEADIPTGATEYYMATLVDGTWYFSPNYEIQYNDLELGDEDLRGWAPNSSTKKRSTL